MPLKPPSALILQKTGEIFFAEHGRQEQQYPMPNENQRVSVSEIRQDTRFGISQH